MSSDSGLELNESLHIRCRTLEALGWWWYSVREMSRVLGGVASYLLSLHQRGIVLA